MREEQEGEVEVFLARQRDVTVLIHYLASVSGGLLISANCRGL